MTLVATYDQPNARVTLVTTGLITAGATIYSIQRGPTASGPWTTVRGASNILATTNSAETYYDYEYVAGPGVTNFYRVISRARATFIGVGSAISGTNADPLSLSPTWHASTAAGDLLVLTLTGNFTAPDNWPPAPSGTGWTLVFAANFDGGTAQDGLKRAVWIKKVMPGEVGPTSLSMTFFGMVGLGDGQAQIATFRNVRPVVLLGGVGGSQPASTSLVRFPNVSVSENFATVIAEVNSGNATGWTSVAASSGFTMMSSPGATRASLAWQYQVQGLATNVASADLTITGGSHAQSVKAGSTIVLSWDADNAAVTVLFTDNEATPLDVVWLKDPLRPPRNRIVQVASPTSMVFAARSGLFDIKGRADPIEVSEIRRAESWTQRWVFTTFDELDDLIDLFAPGRTLYLQVPARGTVPDCPPWPRNLPGGYIYTGDLSQQTAPDDPIPGTLTAPVQIVAAPDPGLDYLENPVP